MNVYIYTLEHPTTGEVRYVGQTVNPTLRYKQHLRGEPFRKRKAWMDSLAALGLKPKMEILEEVEEENILDAEWFWIEYLQFLGCRLLNFNAKTVAGSRVRTKARIERARERFRREGLIE